MTPTTAIANSIKEYQFAISFKFDHYGDDKIVIVLPSGMAAQSNYACTSNTANVYLSCTKNDA